MRSRQPGLFCGSTVPPPTAASSWRRKVIRLASSLRWSSGLSPFWLVNCCTEITARRPDHGARFGRPAPEQPHHQTRLERQGSRRERRRRPCPAMSTDAPAAAGEMAFGKAARGRLQRGRERVVPPVEEPHEGDDRDDLEDLIVLEKVAQRREGLIGDLAGHPRCQLSQTQNRAFPLAEERAALVVPQR